MYNRWPTTISYSKHTFLQRAHSLRVFHLRYSCFIPRFIVVFAFGGRISGAHSLTKILGLFLTHRAYGSLRSVGVRAATPSTE